MIPRPRRAHRLWQAHLQVFSSLLVLNSSCLYDFIHLILIFLPTALLICLENTFWEGSRLRDCKFVESFKRSFTLYVESGMKEIVEIEIDTIFKLRNDQGHSDFQANFYNFVVDHYLCKFHSFYLHSTHLNTFSAYIQPSLVNSRLAENKPMKNLRPVPVGVNCLSWNKRMGKGVLGCKTGCKNSTGDNKGHDGTKMLLEVE